MRKRQIFTVFYGGLALLVVVALYFTPLGEETNMRWTLIGVAVALVALGIGLDSFYGMPAMFRELIANLTANITNTRDSVNQKIDVLEGRVAELSQQLQSLNQKVDAALTANVSSSTISELTKLLTVVERIINEKQGK